jgi:hypothetical protein
MDEKIFNKFIQKANVDKKILCQNFRDENGTYSLEFHSWAAQADSENEVGYIDAGGKPSVAFVPVRFWTSALDADGKPYQVGEIFLDLRREPVNVNPTHRELVVGRLVAFALSPLGYSSPYFAHLQAGTSLTLNLDVSLVGKYLARYHIHPAAPPELYFDRSSEDSAAKTGRYAAELRAKYGDSSWTFALIDKAEWLRRDSDTDCVLVRRPNSSIFQMINGRFERDYMEYWGNGPERTDLPADLACEVHAAPKCVDGKCRWVDLDTGKVHSGFVEESALINTLRTG